MTVEEDYCNTLVSGASSSTHAYNYVRSNNDRYIGLLNIQL